jgi:hypothetical protein
VKRLVRFAMAPTDPAQTIVAVNYTKRSKRRLAGQAPYSGMAYSYVPHYDLYRPIPKGASYAIRLSLGAPDLYPMTKGYWRHGTERNHNPQSQWPLFMLASWQEALVMLAAHEAKHNEYQRVQKSASELACELFAFEMLRRYRMGMEVNS